jgi:hypothetical protein
MSRSRKEPKDVNAPKRPSTSYLLFTQDRRAAVRAANPTMKITDVSKVIGAEWKALGEAAKKKYSDRAAVLKEKYAVDFAAYKKTDSFTAHAKRVKDWRKAHADDDDEPKKSSKKSSASAAKGGKTLKKPKDKNAPRRAPTAYFVFTGDRRAAVKEANPELPITEIAKVLGAEWKALTEEQKQAYKDRSAVLKEEYEKVLAKYKKTDAYAAHQKALKKFDADMKESKSEAKPKASPKKKSAMAKGRRRAAESDSEGEDESESESGSSSGSSYSSSSYSSSG